MICARRREMVTAMPDDPRVEELLEELFASGGSPEEVCRSCPELLPQVRAGWQRLRAVEARVGALFPRSTGPDAPWPSEPPAAGLPHIRGYEVRGVLGHGGVGVVYQAWHLRLHRPVALKMLLAGPSAPPQELERFQREAEAVAGLRHPNVVQVYDVGDLDGRPYFTMEFVEGGSLAAKVGGAPQPAAWAASLVATVAGAVHVAHEGGVVHRDLKPSNILLTRDGTPKVTDFGLAWRLEHGDGLTLSGVPLGTPSYVAPEQARGDKGAIGPAADVYALGAILYECLTGRPPFRAETAAATLQQVLTEEPVPPPRLNPAVPRDLATICLKCLEKEPAKRYGSAAALADDLRRFERGEPIAARPLGQLARLVRWAWRRPTAAGLSAALLTAALLALALVGGVLWLRGQQQAAERAAEQDLRQENQFLRQSDLARARAALERAKGRLGAGGPPELQQRVEQAEVKLQRDEDQARQTLKLLQRLNAIRLDRSATIEGDFDRLQSDRDYEEAFRLAGLGTPEEDVEIVATRVKASPARVALLAALDDWASCCVMNLPRQNWLHRVVRRVDPNNVGIALINQGRLSDAIAVYEESLRIDGGDARMHFNLAYILEQRGNRARAVEHCRAALTADPQFTLAHILLGQLLTNMGLPDEGNQHLRQAIALAPGDRKALEALRSALIRLGRLPEARAVWRMALDGNPPEHQAWFGYAELCLFLGQENEYRQARRDLLVRFDNTKDRTVAERTGRACLLLPGTPDELKNAAALTDLAVGTGPAGHQLSYASYVFAGGLADYRLRRFDNAIARMREKGVKEHTASRLVLAMAQHQKGQKDQAVKTLAEAVLSFDWSAAKADGCDYWISHILRREAEALILPNLPAFLDGKYQPRDNDERLALVGVCQFKNLRGAEAGLFAAAFAADPILAEQAERQRRYRAARAAAVAGCGGSADTSKLSEAERSRWREQALTWLRADLVWASKLERGSPVPRILARAWQTEPDLAALRDSEALNRLPEPERKEWRTLWNDVKVLSERAPSSH